MIGGGCLGNAGLMDSTMNEYQLNSLIRTRVGR